MTFPSRRCAITPLMRQARNADRSSFDLSGRVRPHSFSETRLVKPDKQAKENKLWIISSGL